jgi:hypothetical protein
LLLEPETTHNICAFPRVVPCRAPAHHQYGPYRTFVLGNRYLGGRPGLSLSIKASVVHHIVFESHTSTTVIYHTYHQVYHTTSTSSTSPTTLYHHKTISMPASTASALNPRQRLSILTNSTLGHDVSAAFKASTTIASRSSAVNETPAPPPSPVDFSFPSTPADSRRGSSN